MSPKSDQFHLIARHSGLYVEVTGHDRSTGTPACQSAWSGRAEQVFTLERVEDDRFRVVTHADMRLDLAGTGKIPGDAVIQNAASDAAGQRFKFLPCGEGYYRIFSGSSGLSLGVSAGSLDAGTRLIQWQHRVGTKQQFALSLAYFDPAPETCRQLAIQVVESGLFLDVAGAAREPGAAIVQWRGTDRAHQRFHLYSVAEGVFRLQALHSGLFLAVQADGTVCQTHASNDPRQQFRLLRAAGDSFRVVIADDPKHCLQLRPQGAAGARLSLAPISAGGCQEFRLLLQLPLPRDEEESTLVRLRPERRGLLDLSSALPWDDDDPAPTPTPTPTPTPPTSPASAETSTTSTLQVREVREDGATQYVISDGVQEVRFQYWTEKHDYWEAHGAPYEPYCVNKYKGAAEGPSDAEIVGVGCSRSELKILRENARRESGGCYGAINTWDIQLVSWGFAQFAGRAGTLASLLHFMKDEQAIAPSFARWFVANGIDVQWGRHPLRGGMSKQEFWHVVVETPEGQARGDDGWAYIRGQPRLIGAFLLAGNDPEIQLGQLRFWCKRFLRGAMDMKIKPPAGREARRLRNYIKSEHAAALVVHLYNWKPAVARAWSEDILEDLQGELHLDVYDPNLWNSRPELEARFIDKIYALRKAAGRHDIRDRYIPLFSSARGSFR